MSHWTEVFIPSADRIDISRFTAEYLQNGFQPKWKVPPSQSQSLWMNWVKLLLDVRLQKPNRLTYIRTNLKDHLSPELSMVSAKAFVGTETQFQVFLCPDRTFSVFLIHRGRFWDTSLIKILYGNLYARACSLKNLTCNRA